MQIKGLGNYTLTEHLYSSKPDGELEYYLQSNESQINYYKGHYGQGELTVTGNDNPDKRESIIYRNADEERFPILEKLRLFFDDFMLYRYFDTGLESEIRRPIIATSQNRLSGIGENLAQMLNTFNVIDRSLIKIIKTKLLDVNPKFEDFSFNFLGGNIELILQEIGLKQPIHVSKISDGTLKLLCLMAIFYNPNRGSVICIDEPETGLHPDVISVVADGIKYAAETSQMIIATHSQQLLNQFRLSNILVFEKDEKNATEIKRYSEEQFKDWYKEFVPGEMWRQGDIGGNRW